MVAASKLLNIPIIVTEQNPRALGATAKEIDITTARLNLPKTLFSMWLPEVRDEIARLKTKDVVLFGIESHVCVLQTAMDLIANDINVWVLADGVSSMNQGEVRIALERMRSAGAVVSTSESVIFQLMADASHPAFKPVQALVKETKEATSAAMRDLVVGSGANL